MIEMNYVGSSNIEAIGYANDTQKLHVKFLSGTTYVYSSVPSEVYESLMAAPSKGSFLNREIKGVYSFTQQ